MRIKHSDAQCASCGTHKINNQISHPLYPMFVQEETLFQAQKIRPWSLFLQKKMFRRNSREQFSSNRDILLSLSATHLHDKDLFSKSDPYAVVYKEQNGSSEAGFKIRGAVERVWSGAEWSGAERTAPTPLRSTHFLAPRSTAPLRSREIFELRAGFHWKNFKIGSKHIPEP